MYATFCQEFPLQHTQIPDEVLNDPAHSGSSGSKWQRQKRPQLLWMIHQITKLVNRRVSNENHSSNSSPVQILDIGGGKGSLANSLARQVGSQIHVHVLDIAAGAIQNGIKKAKRLGLPNINYQVGDASKETFIAIPPPRSAPSTGLESSKGPVDIVVALHACGHLSDVALGHAVQNGADFCICPCCFSSNSHLQVFDQDVTDFLDIDPGDWSALKQVAEVQGDSALAQSAIHTICAIRAKALEKRHGYTVELKSFPIQYSTRNICLIGRKTPHG